MSVRSLLCAFTTSNEALVTYYYIANYLKTEQLKIIIIYYLSFHESGVSAQAAEQGDLDSGSLTRLPSRYTSHRWNHLKGGKILIPFQAHLG